MDSACDDVISYEISIVILALAMIAFVLLSMGLWMKLRNDAFTPRRLYETL